MKMSKSKSKWIFMVAALLAVKAAMAVPGYFVAYVKYHEVSTRTTEEVQVLAATPSSCDSQVKELMTTKPMARLTLPCTWVSEIMPM